MTSHDAQRIAEPWGLEGQSPDMALADAVTADDVRAAASRLAGVVVRTPTLRSPELDELAGASLFLKAECLQHIGAFKARGASNAMAQLSDAQRAAGVITYSSGNHAQAIAWASARLGVRCIIVMPSNAPRVKRASVGRLLRTAPEGSRVVEYDPARESREAIGRAWADAHRLTLIPPYDHPCVIAGQGTAALELLEDGGALDRLYVPCGGGGLLTGSAIIAKALAPRCEVVGVEPELADDATRSLRDRTLRTVHNPPTIADGTRTPFLGRYTFPLALRHVDRMVTVSEHEIARALAMVLASCRVLGEPSGVLGVAAALREREASGDRPRVGVILSGGNVDIDELPRILAMAAAAPGSERPGARA